jgi:glycosyltransferase involved in cell wall biosynthesis
MSILKPFGKRTLKKAFKVIAMSEYEKSILLHQFKVDPSKVTVIPNGVDLHSFSGLKRRRRDVKSVLYVGCLREYKGVRYLVDVLPKLGKDIVLEIVGKGPLRLSLESRVRELKMQQRVRFYEDLPRRDLLQKYTDADVLVLLSRYEAYSLVVAESLIAGTPCVVTDTSALTEWVDNETCFGISSAANLNELARLIKKVAEKGSIKRLTKKWIGTKILDWSDATRRLEGVFLS